MHFEAHLPGRTLSLTGTTCPRHSTQLPGQTRPLPMTWQSTNLDLTCIPPTHLLDLLSTAVPSQVYTCLPGGQACAQHLFRRAPGELPMALGTCRPCPSAAAVPLPQDKFTGTHLSALQTTPGRSLALASGGPGDSCAAKPHDTNMGLGALTLQSRASPPLTCPEPLQQHLSHASLPYQLRPHLL